MGTRGTTTRPSSRVAALAAALAAVLAAVLALAGCGPSSGSGDGDPATLAPPGALLYGDVAIRPEGGQEEALRKLTGRFLGVADPGKKVEDLIDDALKESDSKLTYSDDVEPWLGDRIGGFLSSIQGETAHGAVVIATTDEDAALEAVEKETKGTERSYDGVDYRVDDDGTASGVVEGFLVIGTERGFKSAVDASKDDSLAESKRYADAIRRLPRERLAALYLDSAAFLSAAVASERGGLEGAVVRRILGGDRVEPITTSFRAEPDALVADSAVPRGLGPLASPFLGEQTPLVSRLPLDSWLALGQPKLGAVIDRLLDSFEGVPGFDRRAIKGAVREEVGLDLDRDVLDWMGDLGLFAQGTSMGTLGGAAVIESSDPARSRATLRKLGEIIRREGGRVTPLTVRGAGEGFTLRVPGVPEPIHFGQQEEHVVVAYGSAAAADAVAADDRLADEPDFKEASESLGDGFGVSNYVTVPPIIALARSLGADSSRDYAKAEPYLERLKHVVSGTRSEGDTVYSRTRIQLR